MLRWLGRLGKEFGEGTERGYIGMHSGYICFLFVGPVA
jgi:hypothetical protein